MKTLCQARCRVSFSTLSLYGRGWAPSSSSCPPKRRFQSSESGQNTMNAVVRELRKQGRLPDLQQGTKPESEAPSWTKSGFVNIDEELAGEDYYAEDVEEESQDEDSDEEHSAIVAGGDIVRSDAQLRLASANANHFEDVSDLTEDELRDRVRKSIEELVSATDIGTADGNANNSGETDATHGMTPAQIFYMENRDRLVSRAQDYYLDKQREMKVAEQDGILEIEDEWRYYHDPVVRPARGHLWSTGEEGHDESHGLETDWLQAIVDWPKGQLPTAEMLADLMRSEKARDVVVVDLGECDRRDLGTHGILCTGVTPQHCRRLGEIAAKATDSRGVRHVEAFCYGTRRDEWVVAHCGSVKVHIFTRDTREEYNLQLLWESPEQFFVAGDFPHYVEIYGTAGNAMQIGEHITTPSGSRSTARLPAPFRDEVNSQLQQVDYEAAEDAQYMASGTRIRDTTGSGHGVGDTRIPQLQTLPGSGMDPDPFMDQNNVSDDPSSSGGPIATQFGDESDTDDEGDFFIDQQTSGGRKSRRGLRSALEPVRRDDQDSLDRL